MMTMSQINHSNSERFLSMSQIIPVQAGSDRGKLETVSGQSSPRIQPLHPGPAPLRRAAKPQGDQLKREIIFTILFCIY